MVRILGVWECGSVGGWEWRTCNRVVVGRIALYCVVFY